ncbi:MAG: hypothetical protein WAK96_03925 [Desulfobaccales bacterium]
MSSRKRVVRICPEIRATVDCRGGFYTRPGEPMETPGKISVSCQESSKYLGMRLDGVRQPGAAL